MSSDPLLSLLTKYGKAAAEGKGVTLQPEEVAAFKAAGFANIAQRRAPDGSLWVEWDEPKRRVRESRRLLPPSA